MGQRIRIGVVAPGTRIDEALAERVQAFAADAFLDQAPEIVFHPQCFLSDGHFAGDDAARAQAFLEVANDPKFDALWVARGGYGACRMAEAVLAGYHESARAKTYLGYSDAGAILAGLYDARLPQRRARPDADRYHPRGRRGGGEAGAGLSDRARPGSA